MKNNSVKIIIVCLSLYLLDITKPFGYHLAAELSFLGAVFFALNASLFASCVCAVLTGYAVDCMSISGLPLHTIEFPLLALSAHYVLFHFRKKAIKITVFFALLFIHIALRMNYAVFSSLFGITYIAQSALIYLLINRIIKQWITPLSAEPISPAF